jgi:hypothetical protein
MAYTSDTLIIMPISLPKSLSCCSFPQRHEASKRRSSWTKGKQRKESERRVSKLDLIATTTAKRQHTTPASLILTDCETLPSDEDTSQSSGSNFRKGCLRVRSQGNSIAQRHGRIEKTENAVSWGTIEIHSHVIELGDNPAVSHGPPITLGRERTDSCKLSVDDYESRLEGRRSKRELILPGALREDWLRELGYSRKELREAVSIVKMIKIDRRSSAEDGKLWEKLRKCTYTHKQKLHVHDAKIDSRTSEEDGKLWKKLRKWTRSNFV